MISISPQDLTKALSGNVLVHGKAHAVNHVHTDSRTIRPGDFFLCLGGPNFDGHAFAPNALAKGAMGVIGEKNPPHGFPPYAWYVQVPSCYEALLELARIQRRHFRGPVVGVTGSHGKTSTKEWLKHLLSGRLAVLANEKNYNNEFGVAYTWLGLQEAHEVAVIEMGMRGPGQIAQLAEICKPSIGVITALGTAHLGELGSLENIARAKGELFAALSPHSPALYPETVSQRAVLEAVSQGHNEPVGTETGWEIVQPKLHKDGTTTFVLHAEGGVHPCRIPMWGLGQIENLLLALRAARHLGPSLEELLARLESFPALEGRLQLTRLGDNQLLNDAYNASPESMREALAVTQALEGFQNKYLVLGDMLELGEEAASLHEALAEPVLAVKPAKVYLVGEQMARLAQVLVRQQVGFPVFHARAMEGVLEEVKHDLKKSWKNLVLVKASHGVGLHALAGRLEEALT